MPIDPQLAQALMQALQSQGQVPGQPNPMAGLQAPQPQGQAALAQLIQALRGSGAMPNMGGVGMQPQAPGLIDALRARMPAQLSGIPGAPTGAPQPQMGQPNGLQGLQQALGQAQNPQTDQIMRALLSRFARGGQGQGSAQPPMTTQPRPQMGTGGFPGMGQAQTLPYRPQPGAQSPARPIPNARGPLGASPLGAPGSTPYTPPPVSVGEFSHPTEYQRAFGPVTPYGEDRV